MEAVMSRLRGLSADELREEFARADVKCGPITATTRATFERKLARVLAGPDSSVTELDNGSSAGISGCAPSVADHVNPVARVTAAVASTTAATSSSSSNAASEEMDFGYGVGLNPPEEEEISVSPTFYYGVCPLWEDVLSRNEENMEVDTINRERANTFKSLCTQDLNGKLRKEVEKGDQVAFGKLVWSNPRYLIGSGDNPTIVQGCRYNVMHVAAKENQAGIAKLLLDTLENQKFMRLMYPNDQEVMLPKRVRYIVDLYLNIPDKTGFETPLHFACKFGCPDVVNVLCSHPDIEKNCKNKEGQRPCDLICSRKNKTQEVKQKISDFLEDRCYIPLLRATDNTCQPIIADLWSPESSENLSLIQRYTRSPKDPLMTVTAFAGPLSPSKADDFRRSWKTPPRDRADLFHNILKSDPDRGAERVGRDLAHEMGHPWAEYWDFLDSFVDLSSTEGLRKLEEFLGKKDFSPRGHDEAGENETSNRFKSPSPGDTRDAFSSSSAIDLNSGLNRLSLSHSIQDSEALEGPSWRTEGGGTEERRRSGSSEEYFEAEESLEVLGRTRGSVTGGRNFCARSTSWDHGGRDLSSSGSSGSSYKSLDNSHEFLPRTPPHIRRGLFIDGDSPTKLDREALSAIDGIDVDPQKYPSIHKWKSTMTSYSASDRQCWPSPAVVKPRLRMHHQTPTPPVSDLMSPSGRFSPARHAASPDFSPSRYSPVNASYNQRIRLKHLNEPSN
ncbi:ankyrin repeat and LEM domain-containing protein 2 isoform X2 [Hippoglossus stenolepis]|uniref:ankyrin repeat and LEM domain-containing protein 2 isoform X2 n=1 Tax=Hippoglossus stenolepis TaxID=195615 RepID=UPI001FB03369|nr:ankyrin repeat and LEM domain-containing protein 2 isoform X2 [Hippoglossus stenolepis]